MRKKEPPVKPSLPIVEIFRSIQGEGSLTGAPAVFVRVGGCNLHCKWCDTNYFLHERKTIEDIAQKVIQYECQNVIITGGEPLLYPNNVTALVNILNDEDRYVYIQTNGDIEIPETLYGVAGIFVDYKVDLHSDAYLDKFERNVSKMFPYIRDIKFPIYSPKDIDICIKVKYRIERRFRQWKNWFISPINYKDEYTDLNKFIYAIPDGWRLNIQVHKLIGVK